MLRGGEAGARGSASAAEAELTFSAVFGTLSALSSKTMRPFSEEPIETSKKTRGLSIVLLGNTSRVEETCGGAQALYRRLLSFRFSMNGFEKDFVPFDF